MAEVAREYIKKPVISPEQRAGLSSGDILWQDKETRIFYPENPLVPAKEGIHLRIESQDVPLHPKTAKEWRGWFRTWAKAIGVGKVVSEGRTLEDMWQSFIDNTEYSPEDHLVIDVVGRNPKGESWAQTAPLPDVGYDNRGARLAADKVKEFGDTLSRYFRRFWVPHINETSLFDTKLDVSPPGSLHFQEVYDRNANLDFPWQSEPLFVSNIIDAVYMLHPSLQSGLHVYIGVAYTPHRPWNDLTRSLQGVGLAEAVAQVMEETEVAEKPIAVETSVRITGSWFGGFKDLLNDPDFKEKFGKLSPKWFKRRFRGATVMKDVGPPQEWTMNFHPHVYGAGEKDELIRLTKRPKTEGGDDWAGIEPISEEKREALQLAINEKIPFKLRQMKVSLGTLNIAKLLARITHRT